MNGRPALAISALPGWPADWARLSRSWRSRLDEQIAALTALRDGLTSCIGCLSLRRCKLSNPDGTAAAYGAGARYLPPAFRRAPDPPNPAR